MAGTALEWAAICAGPAGLVFGAGAKGFFDRAVRKATVRKSDAESRRTDAEASKIEADTTQIIVTAATTLVAPLQLELQELRLRIERLEDEDKKNKSTIRLAIDYIRALRSWIFAHVPEKEPPLPPNSLDI